MSLDKAALLDDLVGAGRGTVRLSILAVSALMTSWNLDACTTGNSAGFTLR
jgi:hypothetical protein